MKRYLLTKVVKSLYL